MRVLAADDEADIRLLLELALGMDPAIELTLVESGAAAIAAAHEATFDVVLLDGMMPGMSGADTCRRLRAEARTAAVPVVFLTALTAESDRAALRDAGASTFLTKPFDPFTLAAQLRALVGDAAG